MTKRKIIVAKVFVGIICAVLILGSVFMGTILYIFRDGVNVPTDASATYDNLPNIMGDNGVYVTKDFFIKNNFAIPQYANILHAKRGNTDSVYIENKNAFYDGRGNRIGYIISSDSLDSDENGKKTVSILCDAKYIESLQNKQKYNGHTYGLESWDINYQDEDSVLVTTCYCYSVNFKRNGNNLKKCQLRMTLSIEHSKDIPSTEYKAMCDKLFYSLLDNIVYRNI